MIAGLLCGSGFALTRRFSVRRFWFRSRGGFDKTLNDFEGWGTRLKVIGAETLRLLFQHVEFNALLIPEVINRGLGEMLP